MEERRGEMEKCRQGKPEGPMHGAGPEMGYGAPFEGARPEMMREWMQGRSEEYTKWLKENYPDEATKLEQLKEENPGQYMRASGINWKKYGRIYQASKDNPQLAAVLKEQMALKEKRAELLKQIKATTDEKQKKALTGELEQVVGQQFDVIVKRKQIAYEDLTKKLEELKKEVEQRKAEVEKWKSKDFKNEQVKKRLNELINEKEKGEWD
jgi:chromosome segregation ATPase